MEYQGKKVKRIDGIETRNTILDAALTVIVREGIRGIKHRAVAKEAGVTLGTTSYYFSDIDSLITDAFIRYIEINDDSLHVIRAKALKEMKKYSVEQLESRGEKIKLIDRMTRFTINYFSSGDFSEEYLILEHAFRSEVARNPVLAAAIHESDQKDLDAMVTFFEWLNSEDPEADAIQVFSLFWYLGEHLVIHRNSEQQKSYTARVFRRTLRRMLGVD